jgi:hypothetical protein
MDKAKNENLTLTSDLMMGLSMRPLRKMRSVSLAPTLPFRSSIFSRTCWKAAATKEKHYSTHRARAFAVLLTERPSAVSLALKYRNI